MNILAEASTTEISKQRNPKGFTQNAMVAKAGGNTAKVVRAQLEKELGRTVISSAKATDHLLPKADENADKQ